MQYLIPKDRFEALFGEALAQVHTRRRSLQIHGTGVREDTLRGYDESVGAAQAILALHKALLDAGKVNA